MSSGSSNIDPAEFNEIPDNGAQRMPIPEEEEQVPPEQRSQSNLSSRRTIGRRRRRRRRRPLEPSPNVQLRVSLYERPNDPPMTRQHLNRIIFSIGRCLRTRRSLAAQPGRGRPAIIYSRQGNVIVIDVEREQIV